MANSIREIKNQLLTNRDAATRWLTMEQLRLFPFVDETKSRITVTLRDGSTKGLFWETKSPLSNSNYLDIVFGVSSISACLISQNLVELNPQYDFCQFIDNGRNSVSSL